MPRVAWLTDLHLNFAGPEARRALVEQVESAAADLVLVGGDLAEAPSLAAYLDWLAEELARPIYFVLGNHDYYDGAVAPVRAEIVKHCAARPELRYLTALGVESLSPGLALVGHDGWGDARIGNFAGSPVLLNDFLLIEDLARLPTQARNKRLRALGDEAAAHFRRVLPAALAEHKHVVLLTHVPPFLGACWHEGRTSDPDWAPFFTCHAAGEAILEVAGDFPQRKLTVLCGHTHSGGEFRPAENVLVLTGTARYGTPCVQRVFDW